MVLLQAPPYALAAWLVVKAKPDGMDSGRALATILIIGLAMRLLLLPGWPVSTDMFRYVWDGRVQGAGINPYLYVPADAALNGLRDGAIYPYINRADYAPTIYPPMSQIVFYLITRISESIVFMKAVLVAFEGLAVWAILQLLAARGLPRSRVLLYAWHPLPLWEFARSGHVDIVAIAFLLLAFVAIERRSPILAGVALGAGVLVKYRSGRHRPRPLQAVGLAPACGLRRDHRRALPALYRRRHEGLRISRPIRQRGGHRPGLGDFPVAAPRSASCRCRRRRSPLYLASVALIMAALALFVVLRGAETRRRPRRRNAARRRFHDPVSRRTMPGISPGWCRSCASIPWSASSISPARRATLSFAHWPPTVSEGLVIYGPCILLLAAELAFRRHREKKRQELEERHADAVPA